MQYCTAAHTHTHTPTPTQPITQQARVCCGTYVPQDHFQHLGHGRVFAPQELHQLHQQETRLVYRHMQWHCTIFRAMQLPSHQASTKQKNRTKRQKDRTKRQSVPTSFAASKEMTSWGFSMRCCVALLPVTVSALFAAGSAPLLVLGPRMFSVPASV